MNEYERKKAHSSLLSSFILPFFPFVRLFVFVEDLIGKNGDMKRRKKGGKTNSLGSEASCFPWKKTP